MDVCDAGRKDETLAGNRIVGGTDSVPGLHPSIGAIIKENVKICFFSLKIHTSWPMNQGVECFNF